MKKLFVYYGSYLFIMFILFSRKLVNIMSYRGGKLIGCVIIAILSALLIYLTLDAIHSENMRRLSEINKTQQPKKTELEKLDDFVAVFASKAAYEVPEMIQDELAQAKHIAAYLGSRVKDINNLLTETFSINDVTYGVYKDSIDEILCAVNANFAAIIKRFSIFRSEWTSKNNIASTYEKEIQMFLQYNTEIQNKIEELTLELVRLSDSGQKTDNQKLTELIEQTKNYAKIRQER